MRGEIEEGESEENRVRGMESKERRWRYPRRVIAVEGRVGRGYEAKDDE